MHLHHPSLSLNGKKKGKIKFRNADEARKSRELEESWKALQKQWGIEAENKKRRRAMSAETLESSGYSLKISADRNTTAHIKSLGQDNGVALLKSAPVYTGTKIKGIGTMHKSNAVPIFSDEEAVAIANMRR
jgi:hypothetical protein